nr:helix-turn-helix domain-containing protein [Chloroflexota bacterium]
MTIEPDKVYRLPELAEILGLHVITLRRLAQQRKLPVFRVGRQYFVRGIDLLESKRDDKSPAM